MQLINRVFPASVALLALSSTFAQANDCVREVLEGQVDQSWLYQASYQGMSTEAERRLTHDADAWNLRQSMSLLIVSLNEESRFGLDDATLNTLSYLKEQKGIGARTTRIVVDPLSGSVTSEYKGNSSAYSADVPLSDPLAHSLQIQIDRNCGRSSEKLEYRLVGRADVKTQVYSLAGQEELNSPWGTLIAERWQREAGDVRDSLWLAPARNYALIRVEHVEKGELSSLQLTQVR